MNDQANVADNTVETAKTSEVAKLSPESYLYNALLKRYPSHKTFIPTDYVMSSIDIAEALGWEHESFLETIREYESDCDEDLGHNHFFHTVAVIYKDQHIAVPLFDFDAVRYIADHIIFHPDDPEDVKYRNAILGRYFELASDPSKAAISTRVYREALLEVVDDSRKRDVYEERLRSSLIAAGNATQKESK